MPKHTLPPEKVLNVALSPIAERTLHANLNDTIVLMSRNRARTHLARFVDRTAQTETRSVVDVLFADAREARIWGRQDHVCRSTFPGPIPHFGSNDDLLWFASSLLIDYRLAASQDKRRLLSEARADPLLMQAQWPSQEP